MTFKELKTNIMNKIRNASDLDFQQVISSDKPVVVDVWAEWCGPCKMISPMVEQLARDYEGRAIVVKLNADDNPETTARFGVRNLPTIRYLKGGQLVDRQVGFVPKSLLEKKLLAHLS